VLSVAVTRAAERLGLTGGELAQVTGLSNASVSRLRKGDFLLREGSKPFELGVLLVRLFRSLDAIAGGDEKTIKGWMRADNKALEARPAEKITSIAGLIDVIAYLEARRAFV